jgi:hypothetical protein
MPDTDAVHQWGTGDTGIVVEFIDNAWVGNKRTAMRDRCRNLMGNETTEVTGMVMESDAAMGILNHQVVDLIGTAFEGLHQSTTTDDSIKLHWDISLTQFVEYQLTTEILLLYHVIEMGELLRAVDNITDEYRCLILEDRHLRGCRARVDHEYLHLFLS